jgi:hypothetical protein
MKKVRHEACGGMPDGIVCKDRPLPFASLVTDCLIAEVGPGIFGVPLADSIRYANVAISLQNETGESFIYGYVPIVVAKCGVFLKEKGMERAGLNR